MEELNEIEKSLVIAFENAITEYCAQEIESKSIITQKIEEKFRDLGDQLGFESCPSSYSNRWLFDLCWYKNNSEDCLEEVSLVLECELSDRNIRGLKYDFEKILQSNSEHKVFICMTLPKNYDNIEQASLELIEVVYQKCLNSYKRLEKGTRVLLLFINDYDDVYHQIIIKH